MTAKTILEASNISVQFGGVTAADNISLKVRQHEVLGVIGSNGSGKSTFLNLCTGYIRAASGEIRFDGRVITHLSPRQITRLGITRAFQHPQLFLDKTVFESIILSIACGNYFWNLGSVQRPQYRDKAESILDMFGLSDYGGTFNSQLPEGIKKLVDIAIAMALKPSLLLLDEPTSSVSSANKFVIMDTLMPILRESKVTAIIVEHDMEIVEKYMDRVVAWDSGQIIAEGSFATIMENEDVRQRVIG